MAIRDLLWACPECGVEGGLRSLGRGETCAACGTRYRRGEGALIEAERPRSGRQKLPAVAWVDRLPQLSVEARLHGKEVIHEERTLARFAEGEAVVRQGGSYLNRIERFGPKVAGALTLEAARLVFRREGGEGRAFPFERLTAVQPSSSTLQIKARDAALASFRFPDGSARFWEELLTAALRRHYRTTGRGEIVEFQPRIVTG